MQRVIDETNRSDPNWQLLELEAQRAVIPDEQNSAINLMNATRLMPPNWPRWDFAEESDMKNLSPDELEELRENFLKATPTVQLNAQQVAALRKELKRASAALAELYQIADKPRGRYPITYAKDFISTSPPHTPETRILAELLSYDGLVRAQDQNLEGALTACRCIIHAQRAVGDEPMLISLLVRMALHRLALGDLERILAQGELGEAALARMQKLLEEEAGEPLFLIGARGERGMEDGVLTAIQNGDLRLQSLSGLSKSALGGKGDPNALHNLRLMITPGAIKADRAALLRFNNEVVAIARRPIEEQGALLEQLEAKVNDLPWISGLLTPAWSKLIDGFRRDKADLRCALVMVAAERYRKARGRWPETLADLVPAYLDAAPTDPYDGKALRLRRTREGVVIYSVSVDGQDDGGNLDERPMKGTDRGFRLWNVSLRRQPAKGRSGPDSTNKR
ncbi:MAG: hypothetical protein E6K70_23205 [Planctomycetota bacterium]|nr:MAG: hypothetical protein E6K70_23205 [Planctomycetota bacterium]